MQFMFLFLIVFCMSKSQADLESSYLYIGPEALEKSVYPRYARYVEDREEMYMNNEGRSAYLHELLTKKPALFENKFPSTTVEEINHALDVLKTWVKYQRNRLDRENVWGFDFFPKVRSLENSKRLRRKYISVFNRKIDQLREKRKSLYPPKLSVMSRCALFFKKRSASSVVN